MSLKGCLYCHNNFEASTGHYRYCSIKCSFWDKVKKLGPDDCWPWLASKVMDGYGKLKYKGHNYRATRISWILTYGPIPEGLFVLHTCDNPPCVNPAHLFLGTQKDNLADMIQKNRQTPQYGEDNPCAKLSEKQVKEIKDQLSKGIMHRVLARKYGITRETITAINIGKNWSHIVGPMVQLNLFQ